MRALFFLHVLLLHISLAIAEEITIISPHWEGVKKEIEQGFKSYLTSQGEEQIKITWLDVGGTSEIIKFLSTPSSKEMVDLVFGGGADAFITLKNRGVLKKLDKRTFFTSDILEQIAGIPLHDSDNYFFSPIFATFGIICNKDLLEKLRIPTPSRWSDLRSPYLHSWLGSADPTRSGAMHVIYEVVLQGLGWNDGWETLLGLTKNLRSYSASSIQIGKDVSAGEIACGLTLDSYASTLIEQYGESRITFKIPDDLRVVSGDPVAILQGSKHFNSALKFVKFLFSQNAQFLFLLRKGSKEGPSSFNLGRMPVFGSTYDSSDKLTNEDPRLWKGAFSYNSQLSASRWDLMNELFRVFLINRHRLLASSQDFNLKAPLSESEFFDLKERYSKMNSIEKYKLFTDLQKYN